ncbi:ATP-binding cassette domain-containing protein [Oceanidesulfovibrio marinus]|uniref:Molybdenum ABC transporter ATP-binding protein n=1 Tax=Oceanidesulfovibrio marinus TaxID=370038 RepID=A0A6P1ZBV9_9BACT|nr:ATP-binding cassette domain-containing protein [Oceanidesulfovibrio marinus]TVM31567.1 molybdenum ABC transporter ATP-binding protein [Oceanidesulfovibrio marinus]
MSLHATLHKNLQHFRLELRLDCGDGELLAIVGPSGSGKTTVLRCLAGLETLDDGEIRFGQETWCQGNRRHMTPQRRRVGLLSQDALLFPHMTLLQNVHFAAAQDMVPPSALLASMGLEHLQDCKPHEVSGGERQRAALCQVLARMPRLLLLDEPFSALDVENRFILRKRLHAIRTTWKIPVILVTHDLAEATAMADTVLSLRNGREDPAWLERQLRLLHGEESLETAEPEPSSTCYNTIDARYGALS